MLMNQREFLRVPSSNRTRGPEVETPLGHVRNRHSFTEKVRSVLFIKSEFYVPVLRV
jgi:hypothetical protein